MRRGRLWRKDGVGRRATFARRLVCVAMFGSLLPLSSGGCLDSRFMDGVGPAVAEASERLAALSNGAVLYRAQRGHWPEKAADLSAAGLMSAGEAARWDAQAVLRARGEVIDVVLRDDQSSGFRVEAGEGGVCVVRFRSYAD